MVIKEKNEGTSGTTNKRVNNFSKIFLLVLVVVFSFFYTTDNYIYEQSNVIVNGFWAIGKISYDLVFNIFTFVVMIFIISSFFNLAKSETNTSDMNNTLGFSLLKSLTTTMNSDNKSINALDPSSNLLLNSTLRVLLEGQNSKMETADSKVCPDDSKIASEQIRDG